MKARRYIPDVVLLAMAALVCVRPELGPSLAFLAAACLWVLARHPDEPLPPPGEGRLAALETQLAAQAKQLDSLKATVGMRQIAR